MFRITAEELQRGYSRGVTRVHTPISRTKVKTVLYLDTLLVSSSDTHLIANDCVRNQ